MKGINLLFVFCLLTFWTRGFAQNSIIDSKNQSKETITVKGVSFTMRHVEGGTFTMGATPEQGDETETAENEKPAHRVTLSSFYICTTEVTQELWMAVMGNNPSYFKGDPQCPVELVSWLDCQEFIKKLNLITGKSFRLPTEAEWEFAARGGNLSKGYKYAGSNYISSIAWYRRNSGAVFLYDHPNKEIEYQEYKKNNCRTHPVGVLPSNELGLFDMTGNVEEWCQGHFYKYTSSPQTNPNGLNEDNQYYPHRGGCWNYGENICNVSNRTFHKEFYRENTIGLRLAMSDKSDKRHETPSPLNNDQPVNSISYKKEKSTNSNLNNIISADSATTYTIKGVSFNMVEVEGGTYIMGARTEEEKTKNNNPHEVTVANFSIGQTEVTQGLWQAVMGNNPSYFKRTPRHPVDQVSWEDCQSFIAKLNEMTGKKFRLPTEAEWEFAARGGNKSQGYIYSGSDKIDDVAWWAGFASDYTTFPVASKKPNELGIYDMTGNVQEWCQDRTLMGKNHIYRGGCIFSKEQYCRLSQKSYNAPSFKYMTLGFRLAL